MQHTTTPDGVRIAYQVRGEGTPLVLLAGQANNHHWWDGVRDDFHAERSTVTVDYRGTGESDKPDSPYSTEIFAQDVIAVLDALGIDRADVYGTSMGGRVGQRSRPAIRSVCAPWCSAARHPVARTPSNATTTSAGRWYNHDPVRPDRPCSI